jgi:hypothetical protein
MHFADLIFYPANDLPEKLLKVNCDQCLKLVMPYLRNCRETGRIASAVAEIDFSDGGVAWFASEEGDVDYHRERPRFGNKRKFLGLIPTPMKTISINKASDEAIQQVIQEAFENPARI